MLLLVLALAGALSAVLPCRLDGLAGAGQRLDAADEPVLDLSRAPMILEFETGSVRTWKVATARLLVHLSDGTVPASLAVAAGTAKPALGRVKALPEGWLQVEIPASVAAGVTRGPGTPLRIGPCPVRLHSRDSGRFTPYLLVEGSAGDSSAPGRARSHMAAGLSILKIRLLPVLRVSVLSGVPPE